MISCTSGSTGMAMISDSSVSRKMQSVFYWSVGSENQYLLKIGYFQSMYQQLIDYLNSLNTLTSQEREHLVEYSESLDINKGEYLLRAGDTCQYLYFVNKGCLRFFYLNREGQENIRYFAFENKFGTDMSSFIQQCPSVENIEALDDCQLLRISRDDFFEMVDTIPVINQLYRHILESAYITTQRRIYNLQSETALSRLKWLLNYQPDIFQRVSSKMISSYLGVTPFTLSRLKSELWTFLALQQSFWNESFGAL